MKSSPWFSQPNNEKSSKGSNLFYGIYKYDPFIIGQNLPRPTTPFQVSSLPNFPLKGKFGEEKVMSYGQTESPPNSSELSVSSYIPSNISVF